MTQPVPVTSTELEALADTLERACGALRAAAQELKRKTKRSKSSLYVVPENNVSEIDQVAAKAAIARLKAKGKLP